MRAGKCALCGTSLPDGGRRDRRYCRESCRAMAYRQRRNAAAPHTTGQQQSRARAESGSDFASALLTIAEQLKQLREDMASVKKRLTVLEAQALTQPARTAPMIEQAREVVQTLQSLFGAEPAPRKPEPSSPYVPTGPAAPDLSTQASSVPPEGASPPTEALTTQPPPWMTASPKDPAKFVPKWTLWNADFLNGVNNYVERMLDDIPDVLAAKGETHAAEQLRQWIASDKQLVLQVASLMGRRIVATSPAARTSAPQRLRVAQLITKGIDDSLSSEHPDDRQRIASMLSREPHLFLLLGVCLTVALRSFEGAPAASNQ